MVSNAPKYVAHGQSWANIDTDPISVGVPADGDVGGSVPATLSLTLGPAATFGAFTPGVATRLHGVDDRVRDLDRGRRGAVASAIPAT